MRIEVVADGAALASRAADVVVEVVRARPRALLGMLTGRTPVETYAELNRRVAEHEADFSQATVFAIDEFAGATRTTPGTNSAFYAEHLRFAPRELRCPDPAADDPDEHIRAFADEIRRAGGLDLCVLGIGRNGHIAFNEPGSPRDSRARVVDLEPASREAHARTFGSLEAVPAQGMTLGVADLLEARKILALALGTAKSAVVRDAIEGAQTAALPASWLQSHGDVTWVLDEAAASELRGASHRRSESP